MGNNIVDLFDQMGDLIVGIVKGKVTKFKKKKDNEAEKARILEEAIEKYEESIDIYFQSVFKSINETLSRFK